jgi:hypothetical protein
MYLLNNQDVTIVIIKLLPLIDLQHVCMINKLMYQLYYDKLVHQVHRYTQTLWCCQNNI